MILTDIIKNKKVEVELLKKSFKSPISGLAGLPKTRDLISSISGNGIRLIAEVKAASPSAGDLVADYDPVKIAKKYEKAGASAISVLTDKKYFKGSIGHLSKVRSAVSLPILRKDFIIDASQIYESRLAGADAILLIARILRPDQLKNFIDTANDLGMGSLVEVHSVHDARIAIEAGAIMIGINNRDLDTLKVDLSTTAEIVNALPKLKEKVLVSESGIKNRKDIDMLKSFGINAVLIGEAILISPDIGNKIRD